MKTLVLTAISLFLYTFSTAQSQLTVTFTGLNSDKGELLVSLYNSEEGFLKESFKGEKATVENGTVTIIFKDIPEGTYAISSFHDENSNEKMGKNMLGIPTEDYGFSNNAKGRFGPAKWVDAKFEVEGTEVTHEIKY